MKGGRVRWEGKLEVEGKRQILREKAIEGRSRRKEKGQEVAQQIKWKTCKQECGGGGGEERA